MGRIVVSENISLDGVIEDPTGDEGFAHGGWFSRLGDDDRKAWAEVEFEEALAAEALLMGRRSYEYFEARWPSRTGEWADRLRSIPKYVISSTLQDPTWGNSTVLQGDVIDEATKLKQSADGDIVVYASGGLVPSLLEHGLVDEVRLMVCPWLLGGRHSLFRDGSVHTPLRLLRVHRVGDGLALLTYALVRDA